MAAGTTRKISAASARAHTRRPKPKTPSKFSGILKKILLVGFVGLFAWAYQATRPPPPKTCGSTNGPPVTASRIQLKDGRYLAYVEHGVPKDISKHKIVFLHGFDSCRHDVAALSSHLSPDIVESKQIYIVSFDRPGYGESDPDPTRTAKSLAFDIEELADQLGLGSKFYVVGYSMGGQVVWSCLKYIPHRSGSGNAGGQLLVAVFSIKRVPIGLRAAAQTGSMGRSCCPLYAMAHLLVELPEIIPASSVISYNPAILSNQDKELIPRIRSARKEYLTLPRQQGEFESIHRDMMVGFGTWEFDPMDLENPFPEKEGSVHLWQGDDDQLVPAVLQRYIADLLPWINYHEIPGAGHLLLCADGLADSIVQELVA